MLMLKLSKALHWKVINSTNIKERTLHDSYADFCDQSGTNIRTKVNFQVNTLLTNFQLGKSPKAISDLCLLLDVIKGVHCCTKDQEAEFDGNWSIYNQSYYSGLYLPMAQIIESFVLPKAQLRQLKELTQVSFYDLLATIVCIIFMLISLKKLYNKHMKKNNSSTASSVYYSLQDENDV